MYFGDNNLSLPQFRPGGNDNKNRSGCLRDSKKMRIIFFWEQKILERKKSTFHDRLTILRKINLKI